MANESKTMGFPQFFTDTEDADAVRRQFLEVPTEAASQAALGSAIELMEFLGKLPEAFVASQRRELGRVMKSADEKDPRVDALKTSIEQAEALQTTARRGQARAQRALGALADNKDVVHGFVSDTAFTPIKGLTVRLVDSNNPRVNPMSATTDDDGYFNIPLGTKRKTSPGLSQIIELFTGPGPQPGTASAAASADANTRQVEILRKSTILHSDPVLVPQESGSVYREYVITESEPASDSDYREFATPASQPDEPAGVKSRRKKSSKPKGRK